MRNTFLNLSKTEAETFHVILSFMKWKYKITGDPRRARCFTYDSLFRHADVIGARIKRLTLDRNVRRLRELGFLYSFTIGKGRGKQTVYCLDRELAESLLDWIMDT